MLSTNKYYVTEYTDITKLLLLNIIRTAGDIH